MELIMLGENIIRFPSNKSPKTIEDLVANHPNRHIAAIIYYDNVGGIHFQCTDLMDWYRLMKACNYIIHIGNVNQDVDQNPKGPKGIA